MSLIKILISGLVQALTEFLPVSSSGHLSLFQHFLNTPNGLFMDIFFNAATLCSVLFFFRKQIKPFIKTIPYLIISTIPLIIFVAFFEDKLESFFENVNYLPYFFSITSLYLLSSKFSKTNNKPIDYKKALIIGLAQMTAIAPGISRSAATISTSLLLGLSPLEAFTYSYYLYIPASFGALFLYILKPSSMPSLDVSYLLSFLICAIVGYFCLILIKKIITTKNFWKFGFYTLAVSLISFLLLL